MNRGVSALEYAGPASSSTTKRDPSSDSRAARAAPDDPAPTTTTSNPDPTNASSRDKGLPGGGMLAGYIALATVPVTRAHYLVSPCHRTPHQGRRSTHQNSG
jgi:hypothetical protein